MWPWRFKDVEPKFLLSCFDSLDYSNLSVFTKSKNRFHQSKDFIVYKNFAGMEGVQFEKSASDIAFLCLI